MTTDDVGRLEQRTDALGRDLRGEMRALIDETKAEMRALNEETRAEMRMLNDGLRVEMRTLNDETKAMVTALNADTRRHMHVLHEDLVDRISALAPDYGQIRRECRQANDDLRETMDRRLTPLEAAERARRRKS